MEKGRENFEFFVRSQCRGSVTTSRSSGPVRGSIAQTEILVGYVGSLRLPQVQESQ
jgi:hypothetical protein